MKNFFISVIIILILAALLQKFFAWWIIVLPAFAIGFLHKQKSLASFFAGFVAIFLLWSLYAYTLSSANENILAAKVANLLPLNGSVTSLLLVTGVVGGLVSGFAALSGNLAGKLRE